ncbi:helix-turn-helix domain-containing protein [Providencia rettgeri]|uniref:helix-turn-helix domain-containing protein n=1 Tax=Providencia rettgeri TaxID=587 RepID=UPI001373FA2C|nr:helix-turn-helix transcriptional regulator [Providencia rettgeri]BBU96272.1 transcriptional regulator [Providencia rettgeri]
MATKFGKFLRKLRIDRGMVIRDMAEILGVSPAYLSAIELGKRAIPDTFVDSLCTAFKLNNDERRNMLHLVDISQPSIKIDLTDAEDANRETMLAFARKFKELDDEQLNKLNQMLKD